MDSGVLIDDSNNLLLPTGITQALTGSFAFFTDLGAVPNIARFDRVFVGEGATYNGQFFPPFGTVVPTDVEGAAFVIRDAQFLSFSKIGTIAVAGFSRASDSATVGSPPGVLNACIGVAGAVINDGAGTAWGLYSDIQHESGALASYGLEIAMKNKGSNVNPNPYSLANGVYGLWAAGGGDSVYGGAPTNPSAAAIAILSNAHTWNKGIVFEAGGLTGTDGVAGTAIAIDMAKGHTLRWLQAGGVLGAAIRSDVGTSGKDASLIFSDDQFAFYGNGGRVILQGNHVHASAVNNIGIANSATGVAPTITTMGSDSNVPMALTAKGTGVITVPATDLVVGHTASITAGPAISPRLQVHGTGGAAAGFGQVRWSNDTNGPSHYLSKSRGAVGTQTIVQPSDTLGVIQFAGSDGAEFILGATITAQVTATPGTSDMPTSLLFATTADGASSPTTRLTITETGFVRFAAASQIANGSVATVLGSVGPPGASTTVQEWLRIQNAAGTTRFIPMF